MIEVLHHGVVVERIAMSASRFVGKKSGEHIQAAGGNWVVAGVNRRDADLRIDVLTFSEYRDQLDRAYAQC